MADRVDRKYSHGENRGSNSSTDDPPNSRLFIVSTKQLCEDDFRTAFSKFGEIEEIWTVKDRQTGERKGKLREREKEKDASINTSFLISYFIYIL